MHTYRHTHRHRYRHNHTSTYSSPDILVLEHAWVEVVNLSCDIQDVTNTNETQQVHKHNTVTPMVHYDERITI